MVSTLFKPALKPNVTLDNVELGVKTFSEITPLELMPGASSKDIEQVIQAVYRQVLGNIHVMASQRLVVPESQLKSGEISVREFVRCVALSSLYFVRCVEPYSRTKTIELNFKHLLGRAPCSYEELSAHGRIYDRGGLEAEINAYLDSDEYQDVFGENIVPYARGSQSLTGQAVKGFNYWSSLAGGFANSDLASHQGRTAQVSSAIMGDATKYLQPGGGTFIPTKPTVSVTNDLIWETLRAQASTMRTEALSISAAPLMSKKTKLRVLMDEASQPLKLWPTASPQDCQQVIQAIYRQVLGNAYVMKSERLTVLESKLQQNEITVREFVRRLAKSPLYTSRFVDSCSRIRTIELNFKHLLGRAPDSYDEFASHSDIYDKGGFEAEIDSYLDSEEYQSAYGDDTVPFDRGYQIEWGRAAVAFTHWSTVSRGPATSNKANTSRQKRASQLHPILSTKSATAIQGSVKSAPASFGLIEFRGLTWESSNPPAHLREEATQSLPEPVPASSSYQINTSGLTWQCGRDLTTVRPSTSKVPTPDSWLEDMLGRVPVAR